MKTRIQALLLVLVLLCTMTTGVFAAEGDAAPQLSVQAGFEAGVTAVDVLLQNAGGVTNGKVTLTYDSALVTLTGTKAADGFGAVSVNTEAEGVVSFAWVGSNIPAEDTLLLTLYFSDAKGDVTYTAEATEVYASGEKVAVAPGSATVVCNPFRDIDHHWAKEDILKAYHTGLVNGMTADTFAPEATLDRAMFVTLLHRMAGSPEAGSEAPFQDLEAGRYYVQAVTWASELGITKGISQTRFAPHKAVTRQEMATMLHRYAKAMGHETAATADLSRFADAANISGWAEEAMAWAVGMELLVGFPNGYLMPWADATRAQAAVIFCRFLGL